MTAVVLVGIEKEIGPPVPSRHIMENCAEKVSMLASRLIVYSAGDFNQALQFLLLHTHLRPTSRYLTADKIKPNNICEPCFFELPPPIVNELRLLVTKLLRDGLLVSDSEDISLTGANICDIIQRWGAYAKLPNLNASSCQRDISYGLSGRAAEYPS